MSNIVDQLLKLDANEIEMPKGTHKMYCKKIGKELEFEIEAIDAEKVAEIQEMAIDERKIMNGTHGTVFLDGEEVAELKAFQAKLEFQKEEVKVAGKMATGTKYMGYSGKGSLTLHKVNSRMIKAIGQQIKEGKEPRFTVIGKLADPDGDGVERIALNNVSFDDLTLFDFEVGALGQTECPFTFTDYDFLDLI